MQLVEELRVRGIPCYYTMDAGPNVKVLCLEKDVAQIKAKLAEAFNQEQLLLAAPGPGAHLLA